MSKRELYYELRRGGMDRAEATKRVKPGTPFVLGGAICDYYSGVAIKDYIGPVMSNGVLMQTWLDDDGCRAWAVVSLHAEYDRPGVVRNIHGARVPKHGSALRRL